MANLQEGVMRLLLSSALGEDDFLGRSLALPCNHVMNAAGVEFLPKGRHFS